MCSAGCGCIVGRSSDEIIFNYHMSIIKITDTEDGQVSHTDSGNESHNLRNMNNGDTLCVRTFV